MKIEIFGTGTVGRTLAEKFIADGDEVTIGTRNVGQTLLKNQTGARGGTPYKEWQNKNPEVKLGTFAMMWIDYAFKTNSWTHAFKLMRK